MAKTPQVRVVEALPVATTRRKKRNPQHPFNIKSKPFAIVPFLIAPVQPGDTMTNLLLQSRVVTDPINHPLIGWWQEYYIYYVPLMGLPNMAATMRSAFVDATTSTAALKAGANSVPLYTYKSGMDYVNACLEVVVEHDFRDEGVAHDAFTIDGYPKARVMAESWDDSLKLQSAGADDIELPGVDEMEELDVLPGFSSEYAQWEMMRDIGLVDVSYEDYLRASGVDVPEEDVKTGDAQLDYKPELIRFKREWTYPTNHVDPTTGAPSSACSWSIAERADKKRFFKHPGFIFGVTITRPKLYRGNQKGAAVGLLDDAYAWLPAYLAGSHPYTGIQLHNFSATEGIVQNQAANYSLDTADLFAFGDQFVNHAMSVAANHGVGLPSAAMEKQFVADADITALFKTAGTEYIKQDGLVSLSILSRVRETT